MVLKSPSEQFPRLHGGCIEEGALWVVPWLKRLDAAQEIFVRTEPGLALPLRASEYVHRQLRFTPHPTEPVGWMIDQAGDDLFMFSKVVESDKAAGEPATESTILEKIVDMSGEIRTRCCEGHLEATQGREYFRSGQSLARYREGETA